MITREDIEACGWELDQSVDGTQFYYHKDYNMLDKFEFCLSFHKSTGDLEIYDTKRNTNRTFYGFLDNEDELRFIMNKLRI